MQRRRFLQSLFSFIALTAAPAAKAASRAPSPAWVRIQTSPLADFQYYDGETVWPVLRPGDRLNLVREMSNTYDFCAVRVEWKGFMLGYIPQAENRAIARLLDKGKMLTARIARLKESHIPWERVRMDILVMAEKR